MLSQGAKDEIKPLLRLALPIFLSLMSFWALSMTELVVAGHLGTNEFTAVAYTQMVLDFTIIVFTHGFNKGLDALASQAFGAKNYQLIGLYTQMCCSCLTIACIPVGIVWWYSADVLESIADISPRSVHFTRIYSRLSIFWLWPRLMFQIESVFFQAQQIVLPSAVFSMLAVILNILLSVSLVYGIPFCGFSGIGFIGCPVAMIITQYARLFAYTFYMTTYKGLHRQAWVWNLEFLDTRYIKALLAVGIPLMLGQAFENAQFQTMALFASMCSEIALGAHNATIQLVFFLSTPIFGLQNAGACRIGMYLGAGNPNKAIDVAHLIFASIVTMSIVIATPWMLLRNYVGMLYSNDERVLDTMGNITIIAAGGYLALAVFYYSMAVLRAQARAVPVMGAFVCGAWLIGVPSAYIIGITEKLGIIGVWIGMALGYIATTSMGFYFVYHTNWSDESKKAVERSSLKSVEKIVEPNPLQIEQNDLETANLL